MLTQQLEHIKTFFKMFDCNVETGREGYEHITLENERVWMENLTYIRFDKWLTIYQDDNTYIVDHQTSNGDDVAGVLPTINYILTDCFHTALEYAARCMIERQCVTFVDHLADDAWWEDELGYDPGISQDDYERIERELAKERAWFTDDIDETNVWWGGY